MIGESEAMIRVKLSLGSLWFSKIKGVNRIYNILLISSKLKWVVGRFLLKDNVPCCYLRKMLLTRCTAMK